ncbi:hypothetical protein D9M70_471810 [compost metagenome]
MRGLFAGPGAEPRRDQDPEPPEPEGDPEPSPRKQPQADPTPAKSDLPPPFSPAAHHAQSLTAAYAAARRGEAEGAMVRRTPPYAEAENDTEIAKVQEDLRALRTRVEHYSLQKLARG